MDNGHGCTKSRRRVLSSVILLRTSTGRDLKTFTLMGLVLECFPLVTIPFSLHLCLLPNVNTSCPIWGGLALVSSAPPPVCFDSQLYLILDISAHAFFHCHSLTLTINSKIGVIVHLVYSCFLCTWNVLRVQLSFNKYWMNERGNEFSQSLASAPLQAWLWDSPYEHRISQQ